MRVETSNIEELRDMHRMGHTCANLNGDLLFVWGGSDEIRPVATDHQLALTPSNGSRNQHLWIYDTLTGYWRRRSCFGECPPYLSGSTSALMGQRMFIFGGHSSAQDNWLNCLYCLDLDTFIWSDLGSRAEAEPTKPIRSDKCVSWTYEGRLYVFGGYGWSQVEHLLQLLDRQKDLQLTPDDKWPKFGWNNQLVEFNPSDNKWRWPSYSGHCPSARAAHSGTLMGSKYYVFGGRDCRERLNDLYTFDMKTFEWMQIAVVCDPSYRHLEGPIRHLLDPTNEEGGNAALALDEQQDEANLVVVDDEQEIQVDDDEDEEHLTPSPSSSSATTPNNTTGSSLLLRGETSCITEEQNEDDDEDEDMDHPYDHPHPSQLLERWSLSSHQSATSSSMNMDNVDCLEQPTETQDQSSDQVQDDRPQEVANDRQIDASLADQQQAEDQPQPPLEQQAENSESIQRPDINERIPSPQLEPIPLPTGRSFSSFTPVSDKDILLYGGISSQEENLADCWVFSIEYNQWTQVDLNINQPRLWHTGSRTKHNEVIVIGGSSSKKIDEFCSDVLTISLEPKSLKKLALDTVARSVRMRTIHRVRNLPSTICKLIKLRKQARALTMRRFNRQAVV